MVCQIDAEHWATIISAALGLIGSGILFRFSFTLIPLMGYMSSELTRQVGTRNRTLTNWQQAGFGLLCLSFSNPNFRCTTYPPSSVASCRMYGSIEVPYGSAFSVF